MFKLRAERDGEVVRDWSQELLGLDEARELIYEVEFVDEDWPEGCDAVAVDERGRRFLFETDAWTELCPIHDVPLREMEDDTVYGCPECREAEEVRGE